MSKNEILHDLAIYALVGISMFALLVLAIGDKSRFFMSL